MGKRGNRRGISMLMLGVILLALLLIYIYMVYTNKLSEHFQNQNYNQYACRYMENNADSMSLKYDIFGGLLGTAKARPMEAAKGVAACGLELPMYQNNTGNITETIRKYAADACEYGRNNTFNEITWVRSLPVNATNGDIDYATMAPSGPPGMSPCYLIWRINTTYTERIGLSGAYGSTRENDLKSGKILQKVPTTVRIDYFGRVFTTYDKYGCSTGCNPVSYVEMWGVPE